MLHEHPTTGTPVDVPLPRKVMRIKAFHAETRGSRSYTVTHSNEPLLGSIIIASPVSYQGGRTEIVGGPSSTSFSWKCPKTTCVKPMRERPKACICSIGSRDLCLKLESESRCSMLSTNLRAIFFGMNFSANFDSAFFDAQRQKRYGMSRSLIRSPWMIRYFLSPAATAYSIAMSVTPSSTNEPCRKKSRLPST